MTYPYIKTIERQRIEDLENQQMFRALGQLAGVFFAGVVCGVFILSVLQWVWG